MEKTNYERYEELDTNPVGRFGWTTANKKYVTAVIVEITDEYDMFLNDNEIVCLYATKTTLCGNLLVMAKINTEKNLIYFLDDNNKFDSKGTKLEYLKIF